jgi:hypothetical protein
MSARTRTTAETATAAQADLSHADLVAAVQAAQADAAKAVAALEKLAGKAGLSRADLADAGLIEKRTVTVNVSLQARNPMTVTVFNGDDVSAAVQAEVNRLYGRSITVQDAIRYGYADLIVTEVGAE